MKETILYCRTISGISTKEFVNMCSVRVMVRRSEWEDLTDKKDEDVITKIEHGAGFGEEYDDASSYSGESVIYSGTSSSNEWSCSSVCGGDSSFIDDDDDDESCGEFWYENPYCKDFMPSRKEKYVLDGKSRVVAVESDDSVGEFEKVINKSMRKKKRIRRIESDDSFQEIDGEIEKEFVREKRVRKIESDDDVEELYTKVENERKRKKRVMRIESDESED